MEKYESRLRSPVHLRMDGKSLNFVVHVVSFFSRPDTCAQFDDREVVYSENGAFATTSAKLGDVYPSTYRTPKSRTMLSKVDSGFRRATLQRHSLSPFLNARRGKSARIAPCFSCGIRSRPAPRTSAVIPRMGHSHFGFFVKSDRSCGMKRDSIPIIATHVEVVQELGFSG